MSARIIEGKTIAALIRQDVREEVERLKKAKNAVPGLATILVGDNPGSAVYVQGKCKACAEVGMFSETVRLAANVEPQALAATIDRFNADPRIHGVLLQLPLPPHLNEFDFLARIRPEKDVDGFHPVNVGRLCMGLECFIPCTPYGVQELLIRSGISPRGKHVVIVGRSNIVGKPLAHLLMRKEERGDATVTVCHSRTPDIAALTRQADIVVAAMGKPRFITADMIRPGTVVIDVGVNRVEDSSAPKGYRLVGDVDFEGVKEVASAITPVPGGVGPMTIAMLLKNTLRAAQNLAP
jgi:methylenetetrahydrofolate dehydrogenase (NADP+)/methenyltetrahydrofolate cyclohydrolase